MPPGQGYPDLNAAPPPGTAVDPRAGVMDPAGEAAAIFSEADQMIQQIRAEFEQLRAQAELQVSEMTQARLEEVAARITAQAGLATLGDAYGTTPGPDLEAIAGSGGTVDPDILQSELRSDEEEMLALERSDAEADAEALGVPFGALEAGLPAPDPLAGSFPLPPED